MKIPMQLYCSARFALLPLMAWLLTLQPGLAMPADPRPFDFVQPDGTKVTLRLRGDEFFHWYEDLEGFAVVRTGDSFFYASLVPATGEMRPTGFLAGRVDPRAAGLVQKQITPPALRPPNLNKTLKPYRPWAAGVRAKGGTDTNIIANGRVRNLVILCLFSDHTEAANARPRADYDVLFNQIGGDPVLAPTGSVKDAYSELSYGVVTLDSTVVAWVTLPQTMAYYAGTNNGQSPKPAPPPPASPTGYPNNSQKMVEDALALVDPMVDFGQFDTDNDGYIDAIDIIHSGYGAEQGGAPPNSIWSVKWSLPGDWTSGDDNGNGVKVKVYDFHTEPALWGTSGTEILHIGVICHETGHFFGLPDLYDTDGSSDGIGSWCMMANSWGFAGDQLNPPHFSAWCKIFLGWVNPVKLEAAGFYSISQAETDKAIYKVAFGYASSEYLLIENRQPVGFDQNIPRGGLAIWHIDENVADNTSEGYPGQAGWPGNGKHFKVALLQADGNYDLERISHADSSLRGDAGDLFQSLTSSVVGMNTTPDTDAYKGGDIFPSTNRITGISASGPVMSFNYSYYPNAIYVNKGYGGSFHNGSFRAPFTTLVSAYNAAVSGNTIIMVTGDYPESPLPFSMSKNIVIDSWYGESLVH